MRRCRRKQVSVPGCSRTTIWRRQKASVRAAYATMESLNASDIDNWLNAVNADLLRMSSSGAMNTDCEVEPDALHQPTDVSAPDISTSFYGNAGDDTQYEKNSWFAHFSRLSGTSVGRPWTSAPTVSPMASTSRTVEETPSASKSRGKPSPLSKEASYGESIMSFLASIKKDISELNRKVDELQRQNANSTSKIVSQWGIPVNSVDDLASLNERLENDSHYEQVATFLQKVLSTNYGDCAMDMMRQLMTIKVLAQVNMKGAHGRPALAGTKVCSLVIDAVGRKNYPGATTQLIREKMRRCLQRSRASHQESRYELYRDVGVQCNTYDALESSNSSEQFSCD